METTQHPQTSAAGIFLYALGRGGIFGLLYFLALVCSVFLVSGDGQASPVAHFMFGSADIANRFLGIRPVSNFAFLSATGFWSTGWTVAAFLKKLFSREAN